MRTPSSATATEIAKPVTAPRFFVEFLFSPTPWRITSGGVAVPWSGNTWTPWRIAIAGFGIDGANSGQSGTITVGDEDGTATGFINGQGIADRGVNVWAYWGEAPGTSDPIQVFAGVMDSAEWTADLRSVAIKCEQGNAGTMYAPRFYMTPDNGFDDMPAPGTMFSFNGETYELAGE